MVVSMNKEDIIRMAQEAGWDAHHAEFDTRIERFATLVASAERESLRESFRVVTAAEASAAILHEREACAKVCEEGEFMTFGCVAEAIRARGQA